MCRGEPRDRYAIGRTGDVIEIAVVTEGNRLRFTAMLAADADLECRLHATPVSNGQRDELAHATPVDGLEGVVGEQSLLQVLRQESTGVVAAQAKCRLREVVRAEREEVRAR